MTIPIESLPFIELATDDRLSLVRLTPQPADEALFPLCTYEAELRLPGFVARQPVWLEPDEAAAFQTKLEKLGRGETARVMLPSTPARPLELRIDAAGKEFEVCATLHSLPGRAFPASLTGTFTVKRHGLTAFLRRLEQLLPLMEGPWPVVLFQGEGSSVMLFATGDVETYEPSVRLYVQVRLDGDCSAGNVMTGSQVCWVTTDQFEQLADALEGRGEGERFLAAMSSDELFLRFTPPSTLEVDVGALSHRPGTAVQRKVAGEFKLEPPFTGVVAALRAMARLPYPNRNPSSPGSSSPGSSSPGSSSPGSSSPGGSSPEAASLKGPGVEASSQASAPDLALEARAWSAVRLLHGETGDRFRLARGTRALVGRVPPADVIVRDPVISRAHAWIDLTGERPRVSDASSTSGTYLNGERVQAPTSVREGDTLVLGRATLRIELEEPFAPHSGKS